MKYVNFSYLLHSLNFNDEITFKSGKSYSVEQVHDSYWIDLYDETSNLHTFDLRRLFLNDKIISLNNETIPTFNPEVLLDKGFNKCDKINKKWLPITFIDLANAVKQEKLYAGIYDISQPQKEMSECEWKRAHFIRLEDKALSETYNKLKDINNDDIALILLNIEDGEIYQKADELLAYKSINLSNIEKIYFTNQVAVDKFAASIRRLELSSFIKAKCVVDPYLLDETLDGKW